MTATRLRELSINDFDAAVLLYEVLGTTPGVLKGDAGKERFGEIIAHSGTKIYAAERKQQIVSMATSHILPNMTYAGRPYCLVENVVTLKQFQGEGFGRLVMDHLIAKAWDADVYKIMLLTGRALNAHGFYLKLGFSDDEKHAMTLRRAAKRKPQTD